MPRPDGTGIDTPALTRLGYGAANVGNLFRALSDDDAWAVLDAAWESGIRYYDTAPHYGLGLSERRLGAFLQTKPREEFVISTKAGRLLRPNPDDDGGLDLAADFHVRTTLRREWDFSEGGIRASLAESLERLGIDRVDILYLHDPERHDLDLALREAFPALEQLRAEGAVDAVGIGSMTADALAAAVRGADLDLIMIAGRYTLLEQPAADDVLPACHERRTGVVAASSSTPACWRRTSPRATTATSTDGCRSRCGRTCSASSRSAARTTCRCLPRRCSSRCGIPPCARSSWAGAARSSCAATPS